MDPVEYLDRPAADQPPMICAFRGWNDGGEAATIAIRYLSERWHGRVFAKLDPEEFFDFQVNRPTVRLEEGVSRFIEWPQGEFAIASVQGRDVVLFTCNEPNLRWRTFTSTVLGVAKDLGSRLVVTMGAFLTDVPHTRTVPVVGSALDEDTANRLGLSRSQYEGPTGIVGVLHDTSIRLGVPSVSLWAAVPHYLPAAPNPKAALALVQRVSALLELPVETAPLDRAATGWEDGVAKLIQDSEELAEYVDRLEAAADQSLGQVRMEPASGDAIAAELERFLRDRDQQEPPG